MKSSGPIIDGGREHGGSAAAEAASVLPFVFKWMYLEGCASRASYRPRRRCELAVLALAHALVRATREAIRAPKCGEMAS